MFFWERNGFQGTERIYLRNGTDWTGTDYSPERNGTDFLERIFLERNGTDFTERVFSVERNGTFFVERISSWNGKERFF